MEAASATTAAVSAVLAASAWAAHPQELQPLLHPHPLWQPQEHWVLF